MIRWHNSSSFNVFQVCTVFHYGYTNLCPLPQMAHKDSIFIYSQQYFLSSLFLITVIQTGVRWYIIVMSNLHFLDDYKQWICFHITYGYLYPSFRKYLFCSFPHVYIGLFVFWKLSCLSSFSILESTPLSKV